MVDSDQTRYPWRSTLIAALAISAFSPAAAWAQSSPTETRLRDALRVAITQQRALEDENAALRAKQAETDRQLQQLTTTASEQARELDALRQAAAENSGQEQKLRRSLTQTTSDLATMRQTLSDNQNNLGKWQAAYKEAAEVARSRDAAAKELTAELTRSSQRVDACESDNAALYKVGTEILALYEAKGPLAALLEREPATQLKRVQLENLVQDYRDKLLDSKISAPAH